jgi:hypothetical protein
MNIGTVGETNYERGTVGETNNEHWDIGPTRCVFSTYSSLRLASFYLRCSVIFRLLTR